MSKLTTALVRVGTAALGGVLAFAVWLVAILSTMPRPPVPPSYVKTLSAALVVAAGLSLGMRLGEWATGCRGSQVPSMFLWCLLGCAAGASILFPFGGMCAGFGLVGLGTAAILAWEWRRG